MRITEYVVLLGAIASLTGCTTQNAAPKALNLDPKWYWDEAFASENTWMNVPIDLQHELMVWSFDFLFQNPGGKEKVVHGVKYVAEGLNQYPWYKAPDPSVIAALKKMGYDARPCSELRFPDTDEIEPGTQGRYRGIESRQTGERVYIYYVTIEQMISPTLIRVRMGRYNGPLAGGGVTYLLQKRNGEWKIFVCIESSVS